MGIAKGGLFAGPFVGQMLLEPLVPHLGNEGPLFGLSAIAATLAFVHVFLLRPRAV